MALVACCLLRAGVWLHRSGAGTQALQLGIEASNINPKGVIDYLHYYRSFKTEYELACMREAQKMAAQRSSRGRRSVPFWHERVRYQHCLSDRDRSS
ncbi:hypothetical protein ACLB1T_12755 [Escherichia coli]